MKNKLPVRVLLNSLPTPEGINPISNGQAISEFLLSDKMEKQNIGVIIKGTAMFTNSTINRHVLILCLYLFISGCEKQPFDYRTKFVGDYRFTVETSHYGPITGNPDTNYIDDGKIWYGTYEDRLKIILSNKQTFEFVVYEDGTIEGGGYGEFESTEKVHFGCTYGGLGAGVYYNISGEKE
jgi:hypothetical protein